MKISIESINAVDKKVVVNVDEAISAELEKDVLASFRKDASVPGFRKGHVPNNLLKAKYQKEFQQEMQRCLVQSILDKLKKDEGLQIYNVNKVDGLEKFPSDQEISVGVELEIFPKVDLPDYLSFGLEKPKADIDDKEVDSVLQRLRKQGAEYKKVDRPVEKQDYVKLTYAGFIDDKPISDLNVPKIWGEQKGTWEEAGTNDAHSVSAVSDGIVGMKAEEKKDIPMEFPKDFVVQELAGKKAVYKVQVHEVRKPILPELNEEFFKKQNVSTEKELRDSIKSNLERQKVSDQQVAQKQEVAKKLIESLNCELPGTWVKEETNLALEEMVNALSAHGLNRQDMEAEKKGMIAQAKVTAEKRIKLTLCLDKIAEKEKIKLEDKDMQMVVYNEAMMSRTPVDAFVKQLKNDRARLAKLQQKAMQSKVLEFLYNKNLKA